MNILSDEELELIDRHLQGGLDDSDRDRVARLIADNPAWREAYQLRLALRQAGKKVFHDSSRRTFAAIDQENERFSVKPVWLAVAATVTLLISCLLWFFPDRSEQDLLASYVKFPNIVMPIEKSGSEYTLQQRAYQAYELNEFEQSIGLFQSLEALTTEDSLYLGLAFLEADETDNALILLGRLEESKDTRWAQVAEWYKMWTLLKTGRVAEARVVLEQVRNGADHRYQKNAETILKQL